MAVIDASVQVALLNAADPHHAVATAWYAQAVRAGEEFAAPCLMLAEVAAALSRGTGDPTLALRAVADITTSATIQLVEIDAALCTSAAAIAADHAVRGCDAFYVALAARTSESLVTLDRQQSERGAAVVPIVDLREVSPAG